MKKQIGPIRLATWKPACTRLVWGAAVSWNTRRLLMNLEFHYERRER